MSRPAADPALACAVEGAPLAAVGEGFFRGRWDVADPSVFRLLCTDAELQRLILYVADQLNALYRDVSEARGEQVHMLFLMSGACYSGALLSRSLLFPVVQHFVKVTSYSGSAQGEVRLDLRELEPFRGESHVCVVDELIDSGSTMRAVARALPQARLCAVLSKGKADLGAVLGCGSIPPASWLVGFGLDDDGTKRGWRHLFDKRRADGSFGSGTEEEWRAWRARFIEEVRALGPETGGPGAPL